MDSGGCLEDSGEGCGHLHGCSDAGPGRAAAAVTATAATAAATTTATTGKSGAASRRGDAVHAHGGSGRQCAARTFDSENLSGCNAVHLCVGEMIGRSDSLGAEE